VAALRIGRHFEPRQNGETLAHKGSMNYRLGTSVFSPAMNWPTNGLNTLLEITACSINPPPCDEKFAKNTLHADNLAALRAVSAEELIQKTSPKPFASVPQFGPIIDGNFLPDSVRHLQRQQAGAETIAGRME
jgi:carboxylesterase type B